MARLISCALAPALLCMLVSNAVRVQAQETPDTTDWDDVPVEEGGFAAPPGSFGVYGGPVFSYSLLNVSELDPQLDHALFLRGGYGFVILSGWILGGGGEGITLKDPNNSYDEFSYSFGGFLTGYDHVLVENVSARLSLLVGNGDLEMIRERPDLVSGRESEFLERYRQEDFFLIRPEVSIGYTFLGFLDLRATAALSYPLGGENVDDLRNWSVGAQLMFGFRNNTFQ